MTKTGRILLIILAAAGACRPAQADFPQVPANSITQNIAKCQKKRYTNLRQKMRRKQSVP